MIGTSLTGLDKNKLYSDIDKTIRDPMHNVNQKMTPTCGTSSVIFELAQKFPKRFVQSRLYATIVFFCGVSVVVFDLRIISDYRQEYVHRGDRVRDFRGNDKPHRIHIPAKFQCLIAINQNPLSIFPAIRTYLSAA